MGDFYGNVLYYARIEHLDKIISPLTYTFNDIKISEFKKFQKFIGK